MGPISSGSTSAALAGLCQAERRQWLTRLTLATPCVPRPHALFAQRCLSTDSSSSSSGAAPKANPFLRGIKAPGLVLTDDPVVVTSSSAPSTADASPAAATEQPQQPSAPSKFRSMMPPATPRPQQPATPRPQQPRQQSQTERMRARTAMLEQEEDEEMDEDEEEMEASDEEEMEASDEEGEELSERLNRFTQPRPKPVKPMTDVQRARAQEFAEQMAAPAHKKPAIFRSRKRAAVIQLPAFLTPRELGKKLGMTVSQISKIGQRVHAWWPTQTGKQMLRERYAVSCFLGALASVCVVLGIDGDVWGGVQALNGIVMSFDEARPIALRAGKEVQLIDGDITISHHFQALPHTQPLTPRSLSCSVYLLQ